jgi:hypothetical protein
VDDLKNNERLQPEHRTLKQLFTAPGNLCAFQGCNELLLRADDPKNCEVAHIGGGGRGSARYDETRTPESLRKEENLVLTRSFKPSHPVGSESTHVLLYDRPKQRQ